MWDLMWTIPLGLAVTETLIYPFLCLSGAMCSNLVVYVWMPLCLTFELNT